MPDIVIAEFMAEAAVASLRRDFDVVYDAALVDRPDELARRVGDAPALIVRSRVQVRGRLLDAARKLKVIGRLGVGLDNIDMQECAARGIEVFPATGANSVSVAEYVIAGVLMLRRRAYGANADMLAGRWPRLALMGHEVAGATLGLVGFGAIAREVAARARALGMRVVACDPYVAADDPAWDRYGVERCDLAALLAVADAVSLHVPRTEETRHLIGAKAIAAMKRGAVLIHTARGGVVDEAALIAALGSGHLGGAMLDVFEREPLPAGAGFDGIPNLILTPHIAGITVESDERVSAATAESVRKALRGR